MTDQAVTIIIVFLVIILIYLLYSILKSKKNVGSNEAIKENIFAEPMKNKLDGANLNSLESPEDVDESDLGVIDNIVVTEDEIIIGDIEGEEEEEIEGMELTGEELEILSNVPEDVDDDLEVPVEGEEVPEFTQPAEDEIPDDLAEVKDEDEDADLSAYPNSSF